MRTTPLQTYDSRRTSRFDRQRRRRVRALRHFAIASAVVLVLAAAGYAAVGRWPHDPSPAQKNAAARSSEPTGVAPVEQAEASEPTETVAPAHESRPATISIAAVGDMIFDRKVKDLVNARGGEAPLAEVAKRLSNADVTIGNLESTLAKSGTRNEAKDVTFRGHPDGIKGLELAGFDAVSIANNHALDYGFDPMRDTISALDGAGIGHAGAGANKNAAWTPATIDVNGTKVAYFAFTHILPPGFLASDDRPGVASGKMDMQLVADAIRQAKKTHDYVIVSFHWGVEYEDFANGDQVKKAHQAIDAGADMVLAHHPHVIQGVEFYNGKLIAYSLGDFVFDHYSRKTGEAFILEAQLGPNGTPEAVAVPVYLDSNGKPEYVHGSEAGDILNRLKKISAPHGTSVTIDGDLGRLVP